MEKGHRSVTCISAFALSSCALVTSWGDVMDGWVGHPISEIAELWGPPTTTKVGENGGEEHTYHLQRLDPSCFHHWHVDARGVITGYRYEGYCRPVG